MLKTFTVLATVSRLLLTTANVGITPAVERLGGLCQIGLPGVNDLASYWLVSIWDAFEGRRDLARLNEIGVKPYLLNHCVVSPSDTKAFLDKAWISGLKVIPEINHRVFFEPSTGCFKTFDCYTQMRSLYKKLLNQSTIWADGKYHEAVEMIMMVRDPDRHAAGFCGGPDCALHTSVLGVLSAWDGLVTAEKEFGYVSKPADGKPGNVGIGVLFATSSQGGGPADSQNKTCYRIRSAQGGCTGTHPLRKVHEGTLQAPGWSRAPKSVLEAGPGVELQEVRRGFSPRGATLMESVYVPHNNLSIVMKERWISTYVGDSTYDDVVKSIREFEEYVPDPMPARGGNSGIEPLLLELNGTYFA